MLNILRTTVLIVLIVLAGCQSEESEPVDLGELPTRVADAPLELTEELAEATPEVTEIVDQATEVPTEAPSEPPITTEPEETEQPVVITPAPDTPPTADPFNPEASQAEAPPPPFELDSTMSLENIAVGDEISVIGPVTIEDGVVYVETGDPTYPRVQVDTPPGIVQMMDSDVRFIGNVVSLPSADTPDVVMSTTRIFEVSAERPSVPSVSADQGGNLPPFGSLAVDEGAGPLTAFDVISVDDTGLVLVRAEGAVGATWLIRVQDTENDRSLAYNLQPNGSVVVLPNFGPSPTTANDNVIDRSTITVTLDDLIALMESELPDETPQALRIVLFNDGEQVAWLVSDVVATPLLKVNATTGELLTPEAEPVPTPELPVLPGQGE